MAKIDLDAARAARAEKAGDPHVVVLKGEEFELEPEMPAEFAFRWLTGDAWGAVLALFVGEQEQRFLDCRPTIDDVTELGNRVSDLYMGSGPGESSASGKSSKRTSKRSRPTSSATTA